MFVLRDWPVDSGYEIDEGELYLNDILQTDKDTDSGVKSVRDSLKKAFSVLECSLFPDPGGCVAGRKKLKSPLMLTDLDEDFKTELQGFCSTFFSKTNLQLKQVNGINLTGFTIKNFIQQHYESLESGKIDEPKTALEANNIAAAQSLVYELVNSYEKDMSEILSTRFFTEDELFKIHHDKMITKLNEFDQKVDKAVATIYKDNLTSELEKRFEKQKQRRNSEERLHRSEYSHLLLSVCSDFSKKEVNISNMADCIEEELKNFEQKSRNFSACFQEHYYNKLKEELEMIAADKNKVQEALNKLEQETKIHFTRYQDEMKDWLDDKYVTEEDLEKYHKTSEKHALELFDSNIRQYAVDSSKIQSERINLQLALQQEFYRIKKNNQAVLEEKMNELQTHLECMKTKYLDEMGKIPAGVYINPENMKEKHQLILKDVKEVQEKWPSFDIYQKFKQKEIDALDDLYAIECEKMEERKPICREERAWYETLWAGVKTVGEVIWQAIPGRAEKTTAGCVTEKILEIFNKPSEIEE